MDNTLMFDSNTARLLDELSEPAFNLSTVFCGIPETESMSEVIGKAGDAIARTG